METDYRKLCLDLFGTDDKEQLRKIAENVNRRNPRNAGRKKRFSASEIREMETLRDGGMSLAQIAEQYGTSRQLVGRVLTPKSPEGCSMRMIYMFKQHPCTVIDIDFLKQKIYIQNKTDDIIHRAFGVVENPTWDDFELLQIIEKTQGRMAEDKQWIKIRYNDRGEIQHASDSV